MLKVNFRQSSLRFFWALTMVLVLVFFLTIVDAQSVPIFSKVGTGPVLSPSESWEGKQIEAITVIFDGQYKAWYAAGTDKPLPSGGVAPIDQIGYATSADGISWTKYTGNPVLSASFTTDLNGNPFNGISVAYPSVVKVGAEYFLYYRETDGHGKYFIGWATSSDGISWTKSSTPVLSGTLPDVAYANGQWHMWYSIESNAGNIGYATSSDGKAWQLVQSVTLPIPGQYDRASFTDAVFAGGFYHMWYRTETVSGSEGRLCYAKSLDGVTWTGFPDNPVPQEENTIWIPSVIVGQTSYMWYVVGDDVDVVYLASTTMPIPEFEQVATLAIIVTGLTLVSISTLCRRSSRQEPLVGNQYQEHGS